MGESLTSLPAGRTTWCAFSPQTGVDITERTQKKQERASRSYAHLFRFVVPSLLQGRIRALDHHHPFSCIYPQSIRLLLLLWLEVCPVKAWLSAGSLIFFFFIGGFHPCIWQNAHSPSLIDPSPLFFAYPAQPALTLLPHPSNLVASTFSPVAYRQISPVKIRLLHGIYVGD